MWTAADYSVMITGLIRYNVAHENESSEGNISVETKLWNDLDELGFKRESIDHIELGVDCAREIKIGLKVRYLTLDRQPLHPCQTFASSYITPTPPHPSTPGPLNVQGQAARGAQGRTAGAGSSTRCTGRAGPRRRRES